MAAMKWSDIKLVVFDMDGTLYRQQPLRALMAIEMIVFCICRPWRWRDIRFMMMFRKLRETWAGEAIPHLSHEQFVRCAQVAGVKPDEIQRIVEEWLYRRPLKYLKWCQYKGLRDFLDKLKRSGKRIAFVSDYPVVEKAMALDIQAPLMIDATDSRINALKPHQRLLEYVLVSEHILAKECVVIGDRDERDGEMARRLLVPFILINHPRAYVDLINTYDD